jgi:hypothetical protein
MFVEAGKLVKIMVWGFFVIYLFIYLVALGLKVRASHLYLYSLLLP